MKCEKNISVVNIIWPYRPDILIRINFLEWFYRNSNEYSFNYKLINNKKDLISNKEFFHELIKHPYFLQYTRKRRYRKLNLNKSDSEKVYADGIIKFLSLVESIKKDGFDINYKIGLYKSFLLSSPNYGPKINRKFYMGDGCHRLASLIWLEKNFMIPHHFFNIETKAIFKPINTFGIFNKLNIFNSNDEIQFYKIPDSNSNNLYDKILQWSEKIRIKHRSQNVDELLKIKFSE